MNAETMKLWKNLLDAYKRLRDIDNAPDGTEFMTDEEVIEEQERLKHMIKGNWAAIKRSCP